MPHIHDMKVAVTGPAWVEAGEVLGKLERELRVHPGLVLVTQKHFLKKVAPWAKHRKVRLECVEGSTRYSANEALLFSGASEFLVFKRDRYIDHLLTCLQQQFHKPLVRHYG